MKKAILIASMLLVCFLLSSCARVQSIHHDPHPAAKVALDFATAAFLKKDYVLACSFVSEEGKATLSQEVVQTTTEKMHPSAFPETVTKLGYEPILGQRAMNILLAGKDSKGQEYYYRLVMTGDVSSGYKVSGFYRGNKAYPKSSLYKDF